MKKMWKKNNKAVSPVIATILMVAITVVLAAVLYVMVMGFGGDGGGQAPTASLTQSGNRLVISISDSYNITDTTASIWFTVDGTKVLFSAFGNANITFVDAGGDGKVSESDYFEKTTAGADDTYEIQIVWSSGGTNKVIAEKTF